MIVERRDQVLMTFFSRSRFIVSTFFARWSSMKGPFFSDLAIVFLMDEGGGMMDDRLSSPSSDRFSPQPSSLIPFPVLLLSSSFHDKFRCPFVAPRLVALRRLAPRTDRMTAAGGLAF